VFALVVASVPSVPFGASPPRDREPKFDLAREFNLEFDS
jgi:hypothetical protein